MHTLKKDDINRLEKEFAELVHKIIYEDFMKNEVGWNPRKIVHEWYPKAVELGKKLIEIYKRTNNKEKIDNIESKLKIIKIIYDEARIGLSSGRGTL